MIDKIRALSSGLMPELRALSDAIYERPELGFEENFASQSHVDLLRRHGFEVQIPFIGFDTAFKAVYDSGRPGPVIAYMAEYDALPGIGHGCGHNILGASSTGAGLVLRYLAEGIGGQVVVLGTPAEETSGVKVDMAQAGVFKGMDAALMAHPDNIYRLSAPSLAVYPVQFEFFGKTSHAAAEPHLGINALDALNLTFNNINALRQHILPTARIQGIIVKGGEVANVIPDYSMGRFGVRATDKAYLHALLGRVRKCAQAGALATGCELKETQHEKPYDNMVPNRVLNRLYKESIRAFTDDFIEEEKGGGGSIDAGNVSHCLPTIHGYFPITNKEVPGHTREFAQATQTPYAYKKLEEIVGILALVGARLITEPEALKEAKEDYLDQVKKGVIVPPN